MLLSSSSLQGNDVNNPDKEKLKGSPGFDGTDWPEMRDLSWRRTINDSFHVA